MGAARRRRWTIATAHCGALNIGEEVIKGNEVVKEAAELLRASPLNFYGNVEGNDIFKARSTSSSATVSSARRAQVREGLAKMLSSSSAKSSNAT
ncbi:hypothetical protein [Achromobacter xylosoxidans]|uniref:hypothetical protein n=1 Tax=Alcaligenes xylosoxydans xylosoxydans TaxID=85698 RepID=UPI0038B79319